jgi:hypothetical protein
MKKFLIIVVIVSVNYIYGQVPCEDYCLNFDDNLCMSQLTIDTISFPGNIWQIGKPQKPFFDSATSVLKPNAIITDTLNSYPVDNHSVFTIRNLVNMNDLYGLRFFQGQYNVQTDTLNDYGLIEFSPDNGTTWIDLINDTVYSSYFIWQTPKPVLTGHSEEWKYFEVMTGDLSSVFNLQLGDTLIFRFTFISDNNPDTLGGIMYDNICFWGFVEGISEIHFKPFRSKIFPNPSDNLFTIEFESQAQDVIQLAVYNNQSKLVLTNNKVSGNKILVDTKLFRPGIYIYKLTNPKTNRRSWGKFIVAK